VTSKSQPTIRVACGAICEHDNKFLMVREHRSDEGVVLNQPVGRVKLGEDLLGAACREVHEETGYDIELIAFLGAYAWQTPEGNTSIRFCFIGQISDEEARKEARATEDWIKPVWLTRKELAQSESSFRNPVTKACLEDYLAGLRHPLSVIRSVGSVTNK
jgi:ADP-ribose pyrophosphatase YjhB (NUDIX family)